ncbi:hypothetical protein N7540_001056 [Penicillium herquei]|nr:hypothetical protein N7540_001056 [Penicillium herquei]
MNPMLILEFVWDPSRGEDSAEQDLFGEDEDSASETENDPDEAMADIEPWAPPNPQISGSLVLEMQLPPAQNINSGPVLTLPVARAGDQHEPPGPWAEWLCKLPFPSVIKQGFIRFDVIEWLLTQANKREFVVKPTQHVTANSLHLQIKSLRIEIQSALI